MSYKRLNLHEQHTENPFVADAVDTLKVARRTQMMTATSKDAVHYVVNRESGEVDGYSAFMRVIEVDEERFAKLYLSELAALWDLNKPAIRVFTYIVSSLVPNKDSIIFETDKCMEYTGYKSEKSVFTGLSELIEHGIIARTNKHWQYFINPMIMWNGNRVTFAKTYIKKQEPVQLDEQKRLSTGE